MPRFQTPARQSFYETTLQLGNDTATEFYHAGRPRRGAVHRNAYWDGRCGATAALRRWPKESWAYVAYCAGRDQRKLDEKAGNAMPLWLPTTPPPADWEPRP